MRRAVFEVDRCCLKDIVTKFFPCLCFGEDAMAKSPRAIATFLSVANFEDQLHAHRRRHDLKIQAALAVLGKRLTMEVEDAA
jgi:hypothetical protein